MSTSHSKTFKRFKFIWRDGKVEYGRGQDVREAFSGLGYSGGALRALDFYKEVPEKEFVLLYSDEQPSTDKHGNITSLGRLGRLPKDSVYLGKVAKISPDAKQLSELEVGEFTPADLRSNLITGKFHIYRVS